MSSISNPRVQLIDSDGDPLDDGDGKLNINATLTVGDLNIGNVDVVSLPAPLNVTGDGTRDAALRVTIASDSSSLTIDDGGGSLTIDGTVTANLGTVDNAVLDAITANTANSSSTVHVEDVAHVSGDKGTFVLGIHNEQSTLTLTAQDDYSGIGVDRHGYIGISTRAGAFALLTKYEDSAHITADAGIMALAVRNDLPSALATADGDYSALQVSANGGLYVEQLVHGSLDTFTMIVVDNSSEALNDTITTFTNCAEIFLQADEDNSGYVMVGDASVADNRGMKLNPGDSIILDIHDTRVPYLWGSAAGQNVRCMISVRDT